MELETLSLRNSDDLPLRVDLRHDPARPPRGLVVVCHGFKGFRRWGFFPWVGEQLAAAGWLSAVVDFSMNGIGENPLEFDRLDLFAKNTYSRELDDLAQVLHVLRGDRAAGLPVGLLGHSRASVVVLVTAAEDPGIGAVAVWNGVGQALRYTDRQLSEWEREGRLEFTNARTGQKMAIDHGFVRDAMDQRDRLDLRRAGARTSAALLCVHARGDLAVPADESKELTAGREPGPRTQRVEIEGSSHTFDAKHPFEGAPPALEEAFDATRDWFAVHLDGRKAT